MATVVLFLMQIATAQGAWPPGSVKRNFHETPKGLVHYVVRGDVRGHLFHEAAPPLIFFHGHPRSTEMFRTLASNIPASQPFIAVDYFGAGQSDECLCNETQDEFVSYNTFAQYALEICEKEGVKKMVPFGALTGASPAIELAGLAAEKGQIDKLILFEPYYLKPAAKAYVDNIYIPSIRNLPIFANGSHVMNAWLRPDCGPIGPSSSTPAEADLARNEVKTIDWLVNMRTGWQFKMAWTKYNDDIIPRFKQLVSAKVKTLFIYAMAADALGNKYGLDHDWSEAHINAAVPENMRQIVRIVDGTEGALEQNATLSAGWVSDFLGGWPGHHETTNLV